jgi:hypothetical protein
LKKFIFIGLLIACCTASMAQNLTGVWRGYFYSGYGYFREQYKYEVQINHLGNNAIKGVTYSYRTTVFYGKANMQGIFFTSNKNVLIKELNLIELRTAEGTQACAMTCNMNYSRNGKQEVLEGTFTSININTKKDCGSGTVYLEKVAESDFKKEDFLIKKPALITKKPPATNEKKYTPAPAQQKKPVLPPAENQKQPNPSVSTQQKKTSPSADSIAKTHNSGIIPPVGKPPLPTNKKIPPPQVFTTRTNTLVKTIVTSSPDIVIQLFDNGEIDGDTVTVYHNNIVIANKKRLTDKPITLNVKADADNVLHEFVMVADNLGSIPPNTALMVVTSGGKRYEVFLTADNKKNAKVMIEYQKSTP